MISRMYDRYSKAWDQFWFSGIYSSQLALFRSLFGLILFGFYLNRVGDLEVFFATGGVLESGAISDVMDMRYRFTLFDWVGSGIWVVRALFALQLVSFLTLSFGVYPRASALIAFVLQLSFVHRNIAIAYGADLISTVFLFYLMFADHRPKPTVSSELSDRRALLGSAAFRLMQIQVCVIYGYSGLAKAKGVTWWSGDALWSVLSNPQLVRFDFSWLAGAPLFLTIVTLAVLFWEIYFPALVCYSPLRRAALGFGVLMHLGIALAMRIPFFGLLMICTYAIFLTDGEIRLIHDFFARLRARFLKVMRPSAEESCV